MYLDYVANLDNVNSITIELAMGDGSIKSFDIFTGVHLVTE